MTTRLLAFSTNDLCIPLVLMSLLMSGGIIYEARRFRVFSRTMNMIIAAMTYLICFMGMVNMALENPLLQITDPTVRNLLLMLISYAAMLPGMFMAFSIIEIAKAMGYKRKYHVKSKV